MASIYPKVLITSYMHCILLFISFVDCPRLPTHTNILPGEISDAPIYIYIHGGYWQIVDICKEVSAHGVAPLVAAGIKVIVMNYEKCPKVSLEQLVGRMQRAIEFILEFAVENGTRYI